MNRYTSRFGLIALALASSLTLAACGGGKGPETPAGAERDEERAQNLLGKARSEKKTETYRRLVSRFPDSQAAGEGREELAQLLIDEASALLKQQDFTTADERAEEATLYAGVDRTQKARDLQKAVDDARAERAAKRALESAAEGKCASALKLVADPVRTKGRAHFKAALIKKTGAALLKCLEQKLAEEVKAGNVEAARSLLTAPDTTTALDKETYKKAEALLQRGLVEQGLGVLKPMLDAQKWQEAFAKLDELEKAGKLSAAERKIADGVVRDAVKLHVQNLVKTAVSAKKPGEMQKQIDDSVKAAGWESVPEEIEAARQKLAIAVECERLRCKLAKPSAAWAWGAISLRPPESSAGEETGKLAHGKKVWQLAKGGAFALIASEDPGAAEGPALYDKASAWVEAKNLKNTETSTWLPPSDQLSGVVVWAPLRAPAKDYHLGTVKKVEGRKATVERMADKAEVVVDLATLRSGALTSGLKVMAFCVGQVHTEPAKVDSVVSVDAGVPKVKIVCEKGDITRVEIGTALTTKAEWLPAKKP
ncbi:MAG: hypothetical protein KJ015_03530 [Myxococcales bacterium]|nr:hypothetical protein [Myxococcales bacterium]MCE7889873.1 hypothetical protein [Sorangiineae bacterium PRO1]MCL4749200.1 hypothetical protein [Myxococcales bacterium]